MIRERKAVSIPPVIPRTRRYATFRYNPILILIDK
jgi:hypothetical protein